LFLIFTEGGAIARLKAEEAGHVPSAEKGKEKVDFGNLGN